jgi:endonuclease III
MKQMMARTDNSRERDREGLKRMMEEMNAIMDASHKKMMVMLDAHHERIMAPLGKMKATDFRAISEEMESLTEYQEIRKEDAAVMPVGEPRQRCKVWNLAAERCQKMRERAQGYCESRRKLAAICKKVFYRAKVAW